MLLNESKIILTLHRGKIGAAKQCGKARRQTVPANHQTYSL
jgi:hypothetical protein